MGILLLVRFSLPFIYSMRQTLWYLYTALSPFYLCTYALFFSGQLSAIVVILDR